MKITPNSIAGIAYTLTNNATGEELEKTPDDKIMKFKSAQSRVVFTHNMTYKFIKELIEFCPNVEMLSDRDEQYHLTPQAVERYKNNYTTC